MEALGHNLEKGKGWLDDLLRLGAGRDKWERKRSVLAGDGWREFSLRLGGPPPTRWRRAPTSDRGNVPPTWVTLWREHKACLLEIQSRPFYLHHRRLTPLYPSALTRFALIRTCTRG